MRRLRPLLSLAIFLLLCTGVLAACGSGSGRSSGQVAAAVTGTTITIKNFSFSPSTLTVAPGATVTVHNEDPATHTVTADSNAFNTGDIGSGRTVTFKAPTAPGTYPYICMIHQFMQATLVVR